MNTFLMFYNSSCSMALIACNALPVKDVVVGSLNNIASINAFIVYMYILHCFNDGINQSMLHSIVKL